jgi:hypothetical protein
VLSPGAVGIHRGEFTSDSQEALHYFLAAIAAFLYHGDMSLGCRLTRSWTGRRDHMYPLRSGQCAEFRAPSAETCDLCANLQPLFGAESKEQMSGYLPKMSARENKPPQWSGVDLVVVR